MTRQAKAIAAWEQPGKRTIEVRVAHWFFFLSFFFFCLWGPGFGCGVPLHAAIVRKPHS